MKQKSDFLQGNITKPLMLFALPLLLSFVLQALYGAVDLFVVGQFSETPEQATAAVAAVGTGSQLMHAFTTILIALSTGNTILIAQRMGAGDVAGANRIMMASTKIISIATITLAVLGMALAGPLVSLMHVPAEAVSQTVAYVRICSGGLIFVGAYNGISSVFRGVGNSLSPLIFVAISCLINIAIDFALVAGLKMDASGAAIATVVAQATSVIFSIFYIKRAKLPFRYNKAEFMKSKSVVKVLKIGSPIALQDFLAAMSFLIITGIVNGLGLVESASIGITEKLFMFLSIVPMSFMSALSAFVAQNMGAGKPERARKALIISVLISFVIGVGITLLTFFGGEQLARIFEQDPAVIAATGEYLRGTAYEYFLISISFCMLGYFNGRGHTVFVMAQGLGTAFLIRIPLSYVFANQENPQLYTIGLAVSISSAVCLALCIVYYFAIYMNDKKKGLLYSPTLIIDAKIEENSSDHYNKNNLIAEEILSEESKMNEEINDGNASSSSLENTDNEK